MNDAIQPVLSKRDFVRRYQRGEFGNAAPTWDSAADYWSSGYRGLVHIRNRSAASTTWYDVSRSTFWTDWRRAVRLFGERGLYISAMAPTDRTVFQGEVMRSEQYLELYYSRVVGTMRYALARAPEYSQGLTAVLLLRRYLCPNSYDWLQVLLSRYPDHVVEFSCYSVPWGTLPGYNTVFWEVRRY